MVTDAEGVRVVGEDAGVDTTVGRMGGSGGRGLRSFRWCFASLAVGFGVGGVMEREGGEGVGEGRRGSGFWVDPSFGEDEMGLEGDVGGFGRGLLGDRRLAAIAEGR